MANYNSHWVPVYLLCRPCHLPYTIVAKTETIERDSRNFIHVLFCALFIQVINPHFRFIRKTLGHEEKEGVKTGKKLEKVHKTGQDNRLQSSSETLPTSQRFFSQLDREDVEGLIRKYEVDLAMWGYSPQKYLEFAI